MQQLHLVGFTTDHRSLILSTKKGAKSGGFVVALDGELLDAVDGARAWLAEHGVPEPEVEPTAAEPTQADSALTVREVQVRLRQGRTPEEIARDAGVDPSWVERFAGPVLSELAEVRRRARGAVLVRARQGPSSMPLGDSVRLHLVDRGLILTDEEFDALWKAAQIVDDRWQITCTYRYRGKQQVLTWEYDDRAGTLTTTHRMASQMGFRTDPPPEPTPRANRRTPPRPTGAPSASGNRTRSSKTSTRATPAEPAPTGPSEISKRIAQARREALARLEEEAARSARRHAELAQRRRADAGVSYTLESGGTVRRAASTPASSAPAVSAPAPDSAPTASPRRASGTGGQGGASRPRATLGSLLDAAAATDPASATTSTSPASGRRPDWAADRAPRSAPAGVAPSQDTSAPGEGLADLEDSASPLAAPRPTRADGRRRHAASQDAWQDEEAHEVDDAEAGWSEDHDPDDEGWPVGAAEDEDGSAEAWADDASPDGAAEDEDGAWGVDAGDEDDDSETHDEEAWADEADADGDEGPWGDDVDGAGDEGAWSDDDTWSGDEDAAASWAEDDGAQDGSDEEAAAWSEEDADLWADDEAADHDRAEDDEAGWSADDGAEDDEAAWSVDEEPPDARSGPQDAEQQHLVAEDGAPGLAITGPGGAPRSPADRAPRAPGAAAAADPAGTRRAPAGPEPAADRSAPGGETPRPGEADGPRPRRRAPLQAPRRRTPLTARGNATPPGTTTTASRQPSAVAPAAPGQHSPPSTPRPPTVPAAVEPSGSGAGPTLLPPGPVGVTPRRPGDPAPAPESRWTRAVAATAPAATAPAATNPAPSPTPSAQQSATAQRTPPTASAAPSPALPGEVVPGIPAVPARSPIFRRDLVQPAATNGHHGSSTPTAPPASEPAPTADEGAPPRTQRRRAPLRAR